MPSPLLHRDQVPTDSPLVSALLAEQHPQLAGCAVVPVTSSGTDHDVYRLPGAGGAGGPDGPGLAVRLPKIAWAEGQAALEARWLPSLAARLPLAVPRVVAAGRPGCGYPFAWSVVTWLPGRQADPALDDGERTATDLARLVRALRELPPALSRLGGPPVREAGRRGGPLEALDEQVRTAVSELGDRVHARAVLRCWDRAREAAPHAGPPVWAHGDLLPGNLLVGGDGAAAGGALSGVIDWGSLGLADPAVDLLPAWNLLTGAARARFRDELGVDDDAWERGRGTAVHQAVQALPYYWDTNPPMVAQALRALAGAVHDS
ncbi:aminoglycoside phosphotransferase family protein [Quadrisphaera sp. INWT6]|uniref:aminoglycoside phosphotransferase family protein n=1 Tax=Quadrisphaera sp. INWT6 TaxID=2596917 RepID=UPI00189220D5|nr:aminoglycoside phosphotransferase family protein [Quadrisphaera sp. INWT6]MBF5081096.1 aminoglycoside phosphotransferase family protein [Quadrisphaera sp. INWT6]